MNKAPSLTLLRHEGSHYCKLQKTQFIPGKSRVANRNAMTLPFHLSKPSGDPANASIIKVNEALMTCKLSHLR